MNREKEIDKGQNKKSPDPRISFLLGLAFLLFLMISSNTVLPTKTLHRGTVPSIVMGKSGLILHSESVANLLYSDANAIDFTPFFFKPLPINRATRDLLTTLPGIGRVLAESIVSQREQSGFFTNTEDLLRVPGIGKKRMAYLSTLVSFDP